MNRSTFFLSILATLPIIVPLQLRGQATDAEWVEYSIRTPLARRYLKVSANTSYYVPPEGNDQNPDTHSITWPTPGRKPPSVEPKG